jgi:hypothetical protein
MQYSSSWGSFALDCQLPMFGSALDPMVVNIMKDFGYLPTAFI